MNAVTNITPSDDLLSQLNALPAVMKNARRWLLWRAEPPAGGGKPRKVPYYANGQRRGKLDTEADKARLVTFDDAISKLKGGRYTGLGFALGRDGTGHYWQGIDLDDIADHPEVQALENKLPGYVETSPSGKGLHAIGYGRRFRALNANATGVEAYAEKRFFTVTGEEVPFGEPECLAEFVETRLAPIHGEKSLPPTAADNAGMSADERAFANQQRKPDVSEADLDDALTWIDPSLPYFPWLHVGMGLHHHYDGSEKGRVKWDEWSSQSGEYKEGECKGKWQGFREDGSKKDRTAWTILKLAREAGWPGGSGEGDARESDADAYQRLSEMSPADYDRCRKAEAGKLGIQVRTLDSEVKKRRKVDADDAGQDVLFEEIEPWPDVVDGAALLTDVADTFTRYLLLPETADTALALWAAHAHCFEAFTHTPRLNITAPEKGCGKSLVFDVLEALTPKALRTENVTTAVVFRLIEKYQPTLLVDEYDTFIKDNEDLRGCFNAGHKRGGHHLRCEGDNNEVKAFRTFAPVALAGIGGLPGTLHDRSIVLKMTRAKPGEVRQQFDARHVEPEREINRKLARWCMDNIDALKTREPTLPDGVYNREADNWRPLAAIAEAAGGEWPARLREAIAALRGDSEDTAPTMLLADIRRYFEHHDQDRVPSHDLADWLITLEDRPWPEWRHGRPITAASVSRLLKGFGIKSKQIRFDEENLRGYQAADFRDAFDRYLPIQSATAATSP
jgi:hypothetical protein